ncbi:MAG TPA: glycosyltransferase [Salinimicrobium sp.]|nr:glycosyltransferase [Salinimicrobium sp.]
MIEKVLIFSFLFLLFLIFLYSLVQLNLLLNYLRIGKIPDPELTDGLSLPAEIPFVTIQLPVYNEKNIVERLLRNIAEFDYPKDKMEFQVLDDSTDESVEIIASITQELREKGLNFIHIRRKNRIGFKAGALREGLKSAKGEYIAVFDSDFLPRPDWLQRTIPYFKNKEIGVVQTRWGHINRNYSLLTRMQAFVLDFHFFLEQQGRNHGRHFINFNGTAGVWRKQCILDAGNWQSDTLTEDLDLSYRAQMKNWKFRYLEMVETPAELPITITAVKSQQFRWNKGAAENFQKNFFRLSRNKSIPIGTKIHAFFHLLNSSLFLIVFALAVLSVPLVFIISDYSYSGLGVIMIFFSFSTLIFLISYWVTFVRDTRNDNISFWRYLQLFFIFFSIAMGFSFHNSIAVLEGHFGIKSDFIRTPKFNLGLREKYIEKTRIRLDPALAFEMLLFLYFLFAVIYAFILGNYSLIIFHLMLSVGFGFVIFHSLGLNIYLPPKDK